MKVWAILVEGAVFHNKVWTTEALAVKYLSEDTSLVYRYGAWFEADSNFKKVAARLVTFDLHVD